MSTYTLNRRERGQDLVEFAITLPMLLLLLMAIIDLGRAIYYFSAVHNAAREGARYGIVNPLDFSGMRDTVEHYAIGVDPNNLVIVASQPDLITIRVEVTYTFQAVSPFFGWVSGSDSITISSVSNMLKEQ